jgi:hypothetical protein
MKKRTILLIINNHYEHTSNLRAGNPNVVAGVFLKIKIKLKLQQNFTAFLTNRFHLICHHQFSNPSNNIIFLSYRKLVLTINEPYFIRFHNRSAVKNTDRYNIIDHNANIQRVGFLVLFFS